MGTRTSGGHVTAPAVYGDRGFPFFGYDDIRMAGLFSRRRREMILLSTLSDFLCQKTAFLGERQQVIVNTRYGPLQENVSCANLAGFFRVRAPDRRRASDTAS